MNIFIVVFNRGNRRVQAIDVPSAWALVCPNQDSISFKEISSDKFEVLQHNNRIGMITKLPRSS